jgi:hypothetical protein
MYIIAYFITQNAQTLCTIAFSILTSKTNSCRQNGFWGEVDIKWEILNSQIWNYFIFLPSNVQTKEIVQAPTILVDTDFSTFKENCKLLPRYYLYQQNVRTKVADIQKMQLMVFWEIFRAHTWSFMNFQTWWSKTHNKT